jgi:hypothetical protein
MLRSPFPTVASITNRSNSRGAHDINDPGHHREFDRPIAPNKRSAVTTHLEDFLQPSFQVLSIHEFLVDAQGTVRENLYHNYVGFVLSTILGSLNRARLRNFRRQPLGMGNKHKNHQEHQQDID